jgi:hypothetical protein
MEHSVQNFLLARIPRELVEEVFDFSGPPKSHVDQMQKEILPEVLLLATYREIVYESAHFYSQLHEFKFRLVRQKYISVIEVWRQEERLLQLNVVTHPFLLRGYTPQFFGHGFSWESIDGVMQYLIRRYVWNEPLSDFESSEYELLWG